jgi:hypothetical protein
MPHGFFTVEQWKRLSPGTHPQWTPVRHFDARNTLTKAMEWIEAEGKPGFFRVTQTQRVIWAENLDGKLRLRKWHAGSPESMERGAAAFERDGGKWPIAKRVAKKPT